MPKTLKRTRSESFEGRIFNSVYGLAIGDIDVDEKFKEYLENGIPKVITVAMVAADTTLKPSAIIGALRSIGFTTINTSIRLVKTKIQTNENEDFNNVSIDNKRSVRKLIVSNEARWTEIIKRYYSPDFDTELTRIISEPIACPSNIQGPQYLSTGTSPVVIVSDIRGPRGANTTSQPSFEDKTEKSTAHTTGNTSNIRQDENSTFVTTPEIFENNGVLS